MKPPLTKIEPVTDTLHGVEIVDNYRWLEDQDSPETRAWIKAQQEYTKAHLENFERHPGIHVRFSELLKVDSIGAPSEHGGYYFFGKRLAEQEQPVQYRRRGLHGPDEVLLDPNTMSEDKSVTVQRMDISQDGGLLVYGIRQGGEDEQKIHFRTIDEKTDLPDILPKARYFGGVALKNDKSGLYYGLMTEEGPRVRYHALGTDPAQDVEIFGAGYDAGKIISVGLSEDGRWLLLEVYYGSSGQKTDVFLQNIAENGPIIPVVTDIEARFSCQIADGDLYIETNWEAPNGRILKTELANPTRENWREIIPVGPDTLQGFSLVAHKIFVNYLHNVTSQVRIFDVEGKPEGEIHLPTLGTISELGGWWDKSEAFFTFVSFVTPTTIYRYDAETSATEIWAANQTPVPSEDFEVNQVFFASKDGTQIPMFLVHKKGLELNGTNPVLLSAYGGFGVSLTPSFSSFAALWAEQGGVFAVANLRGGGEFGEDWHRAGMLANKQNVFDDFIAAAEWLIENKYTDSAHLAVQGGSNGGLLVGAILTQRPELCGAVICAVPLLDMVRYHQFLVAAFWIPEYGSSEDAEQFKTLYAYSPYHHVKPGEKYPAALFVTGDADTRVAPLHARKMAALLQSANASDKPVLLLYDTKSGHSGGKPINKVIEEATDQLVFLFQQLQIH